MLVEPWRWLLLSCCVRIAFLVLSLSVLAVLPAPPAFSFVTHNNTTANTTTPAAVRQGHAHHIAARGRPYRPPDCRGPPQPLTPPPPPEPQHTTPARHTAAQPRRPTPHRTQDNASPTPSPQSLHMPTKASRTPIGPGPAGVRGHRLVASSGRGSRGAPHRSGRMACQRREVIRRDCESRQNCLARVTCHQRSCGAHLARHCTTERCREIAHRVLQESPPRGRARPCSHISKPVEECKGGRANTAVRLMRQRDQRERARAGPAILFALPRHRRGALRR